MNDILYKIKMVIIIFFLLLLLIYFCLNFVFVCVCVCVFALQITVSSLRGYFSSSIEQPQKADARLHEFLDQLDFDIEKAKTLLQGIHCGGKGMLCFLLK